MQVWYMYITEFPIPVTIIVDCWECRMGGISADLFGGGGGFFVESIQIDNSGLPGVCIHLGWWKNRGMGLIID